MKGSRGVVCVAKNRALESICLVALDGHLPRTHVFSTRVRSFDPNKPIRGMHNGRALKQAPATMSLSVQIHRSGIAIVAKAAVDWEFKMTICWTMDDSGVGGIFEKRAVNTCSRLLVTLLNSCDPAFLSRRIGSRNYFAMLKISPSRNTILGTIGVSIHADHSIITVIRVHHPP
jgi:hypothetical protein